MGGKKKRFVAVSCSLPLEKLINLNHFLLWCLGNNYPGSELCFVAAESSTLGLISRRQTKGKYPNKNLQRFKHNGPTEHCNTHAVSVLGGYWSTSAWARKVTLHFRCSSGCDTVELLRRGKGSSRIVTNQHFLVALYKDITQSLWQKLPDHNLLEVNKHLCGRSWIRWPPKGSLQPKPFYEM